MPPVATEYCVLSPSLPDVDLAGPVRNVVGPRRTSALGVQQGRCAGTEDVIRQPREMDGPLMGKRVTVYDIARRVGVSHTTVARALGNRREVSKERREEIQRVAAEMGYTPDPHLAALANYRKSLGPAKFQSVVVWINHWQQPDQLRHFGEFERYWQGAAETAGKQGFKLEDFRWPLGCTPKRLERMLEARGVEGVLIPPHNDLLDWGDFDWEKFSVLRFGMSVQSPDSNLVTTDQFRATGMAVSRIHE